MAMTFTTAERNAQATALAGRIATVRLLTAGGATIVDVPTAGFSAAADGTITANAMAEAAAAAAGTAASFALLDSQGVSRATGTVSNTAGTGDMKLDSTTFAAGQPLRITSLTLTVKA